MNVKMIVVLVLSVIVGVLRFVLPSHGLQPQDIYKDMSHLFVGGLFGAAIVSKKPQLWGFAIGLTILEGVAAVIR